MPELISRLQLHSLAGIVQTCNETGGHWNYDRDNCRQPDSRIHFSSCLCGVQTPEGDIIYLVVKVGK
jgi:hypothetical protein